MSGKIKKGIYIALAGLAVWGVASIAGTDNTVTALHTTVSGSAWGLGAIGGTAPDVIPATVAGWHATRSFNATYPGAGPSIDPRANGTANPKKDQAKKAAKKAPVKVPNCTKAQKRAAPSVCA